jgi:hypothetical protein
MVDVLSDEVREGREAIEAGYVDGLSRLKAIGDNLNGGAPTLIGECGIQYDMNDADSYRLWADGDRRPEVWDSQATALELMYNALDRLLLSSTQWNYTVSNSNDPMIGDGWNQEDLSIWSADQATSDDDPNSGCRAVQGFCRPYVHAAQGRIVSQSFDRETGKFEAVIEPDLNISAPTEIYVPTVQYTDGYQSHVSSAAVVTQDRQILTMRAIGDQPFIIRIERN